MKRESVLELIVQIEPGDGPPSGRLRVGGADPQNFQGWLAFIAELQAAIDIADAPDGEE